jgi:hypothetical protein
MISVSMRGIAPRRRRITLSMSTRTKKYHKRREYTMKRLSNEDRLYCTRRVFPQRKSSDSKSSMTLFTLDMCRDS